MDLLNVVTNLEINYSVYIFLSTQENDFHYDIYLTQEDLLYDICLSLTCVIFLVRIFISCIRLLYRVRSFVFPFVRFTDGSPLPTLVL